MTEQGQQVETLVKQVGEAMIETFIPGGEAYHRRRSAARTAWANLAKTVRDIAEETS